MLPGISGALTSWELDREDLENPTITGGSEGESNVG